MPTLRSLIATLILLSGAFIVNTYSSEPLNTQLQIRPYIGLNHHFIPGQAHYLRYVRELGGFNHELFRKANSYTCEIDIFENEDSVTFEFEADSLRYYEKRSEDSKRILAIERLQLTKPTQVRVTIPKDLKSMDVEFKKRPSKLYGTTDLFINIGESELVLTVDSKKQLRFINYREIWSKREYENAVIEQITHCHIKY